MDRADIDKLFKKHMKGFGDAQTADEIAIYCRLLDAAEEVVNKLNKAAVTTRFSFKGWEDENCYNPKKNGEYLCLVKWYNLSEYQYAVLEYDRKTKWQVTDSCEHILWSELPPSPFS